MVEIGKNEGDNAKGSRRYEYRTGTGLLVEKFEENGVVSIGVTALRL
jgi:hypothetical protein